jgi:hypothetical protein
MNDLNSLETHLRTWTPRPPSPEVRARIFDGASHSAASLSVYPKPALELYRWLIPALGCFLLVLATLANRNPSREYVRFTGTNFVIAQANNNDADLLLSQHLDHSDINAVPKRHFEWNVATPVIRASFAAQIISYTNKLIQ